MMPFAFAVPFTSRLDPGAIFTSATPFSDKRNSAEDRPENQLASAASRNKSNKSSRSNWKSKLRQPHPFTSREPATPSLPRSRGNREKQHYAKKSNSVSPIRHILLYTILALSFITLILGLVYAGDVTSPATETESTASVATTARPIEVGTTTPISRRDNIGNLVRDVSTDIEIRDGEAIVGEPSQAENLGPFTSSGNSDKNPAVDNSSSLVTAENAFEAASLRTPSAVAALFFYIASVPLLSILFASVELVILYLLASSARRSQSASRKMEVDEGFDSDAETLNEEEKEKWQHIGPSSEELPERKETRIEKLRPHAPLLSFLTAIMLLEGWVAINAIQIHCELVSTTGSGVCPIQTRNHTGTGVHALSIVKSVLAWLIVLVQLSYITVVFRDTKLFSRPKRNGFDVESRSRSVSVNSKPSSLKSRTRTPSPRKSVRFDDEEEEARERQRHGNDGVQYIPGPFDHDGRLSEDNKTPWQWQGQFSDANGAKLAEILSSKGIGYGRNASTLNPATEPTSDSVQPLAMPNIMSNYNTRGGSFDFGLASVQRQTLNPAATGRRSLDSQRSGSRPISALSAGLKPQTKRRNSSVNNRRLVDSHRVSTIEEEEKEASPI